MTHGCIETFTTIARHYSVEENNTLIAYYNEKNSYYVQKLMTLLYIYLCRGDQTADSLI